MRPPFPRQHATFVRHPEAKAWIIEGEDARHGILGDFFQESFVRTAIKAAIAIVVSNDVPKGWVLAWRDPGRLAFALGVKIALPINLGSRFG
ncbi:MAG: hypothetical protein ACLQNE_03905 [Thermoguttaceae bacterium]